MNDLVDTTEMYLRTIYDLEEEGVIPLRARIAERLEQISVEGSVPSADEIGAEVERYLKEAAGEDGGPFRGPQGG